MAAAQRSMCANLLKQFGMAIEGYETTQGQYPPGTLPGGGLPPDRRFGWACAILPWLDWGKVGCPCTHLAWDDPAIANLAGVTGGDIPWDFAIDRHMRCPERVWWAPTSKAPARSPANFVAIAGLGPDAPSLPVNHPRAGVFGDDRKVTRADIKDGLANTALIVETSAASGPWYAGGRATVRGVDPALKPYIGPGRPFGGNHVGGANVLMADGSIRFVTERSNPKVLEFMATIAGGELPSDAGDDNL